MVYGCQGQYMHVVTTNSVIHGLQWSVDYATLDITDSSKFKQLNRQ